VEGRGKEQHDIFAVLVEATGQMLTYDPRDELYAGNAKFRRIRQLPKKRRRSQDLSVGGETFPDTGVTLQNLKAARQLP
jgi:hypothetical protein